MGASVKRKRHARGEKAQKAKEKNKQRDSEGKQKNSAAHVSNA
jgi:hypothetical protein